MLLIIRPIYVKEFIVKQAKKLQMQVKVGQIVCLRQADYMQRRSGFNKNLLYQNEWRSDSHKNINIALPFY